MACFFSSTTLCNSSLRLIKNLTARKPNPIIARATIDLNHQVCQNGGKMVKENEDSTTGYKPWRKMALAFNVYSPGARFTKLIDEWVDGSLQFSLPLPSSM